MPASVRSRLVHRVAAALAVLLPAALLYVAFGHFGDGRSEDAQREFDNAGQILNGTVLKVPVARALDERLAQSPRLVVIGNSFANTNVLTPLLARNLGIEPRHHQAIRLSIPNTIGTHWYALLAHHVFAKGRQPPDYVVLVADLQSALLTEPLSEGGYANLHALMTRNDPQISARVLRSTSFWWTNVLERRERVRRGVLDRIRDLAVRPALPPMPENRRQATALNHLDRAFHPARMDPSLEVRALPVSVDTSGVTRQIEQLPAPEDSFLPDLARLCAEHGTRLIFVRNVASPAMPPEKADRVLPGTEARVREVLGAHGAVMLELRRFPMVTELYSNLDHMTEEGARRFTLALVEALGDLGAHEELGLDAPPAQVSPPEPFGPVSPAVDALASVRRSWVGLPAGATATWTVEPWAGRPETFRVRAVVEPVGEGRVEVQVGGRPATLTRLGSGRWAAEWAGPPPEGPVAVAIAAVGAPAVVQGLEIGTGWAPVHPVGYRPDVRGHRLELLGRAEVFGGEVWFDAVRPQAEAPPPEVPPGVGRMVDGPGLTAALEVPRLRSVSDLETRAHTPRLARCSPARVVEESTLLTQANLGCREVRDVGGGRLCHADTRILFSASDGTDPWTNGREYRLALDPERRCDGGAWLYPQDRLEFQVPPERLRELRDGVDRLAVTVAPVAGEHGVFRAEVFADGAQVGAASWGPDASDGPVILRFNPPIGPEAELRLVVHNAGAGFALLTSAAFEGPPLPWTAAAPPADGG